MSQKLYEEHRKRVKQEFLSVGFTDETPEYKVLEMLLFYAIPRKDTKKIAHMLINHFGSLTKVINAPIEELIKFDGVGKNTATLLKLMVPVARHYYNDKTCVKKKYKSIEEIGAMLTKKYLGFTDEVFAITSFNNRGIMIGFDILSTGDLSCVTVSIRKIIETVIKRKSACVVISHNHPGGQAIPSKEDIEMTIKICEVLRNLSVLPLDHLILCDDDYVSLAQSAKYKSIFSL